MMSKPDNCAFDDLKIASYCREVLMFLATTACQDYLDDISKDERGIAIKTIGKLRDNILYK